MKKIDYINEINLNKLKADLSKSRYEHSINVMSSAIELAKCYGLDEDKAAIAGLFHDCAKYESLDKARRMLKKYKLEDNEDLKNSKQLIHSYLGPFVAMDEYNITDNEILSAIKYHTTLNSQPTLLEKVIYMADVIEVGRYFEGIEEIRDLAFKDLDKAVLMSLEFTIVDLIRKRRYIVTDTLDARNHFLIGTTELR